MTAWALGAKSAEIGFLLWVVALAVPYAIAYMLVPEAFCGWN